jgi:hypothetical protein
MEPEVKEMEYANNAPTAEDKAPAFSMDKAGSLTTLGGNSEQWREIGEKAYTILSSLPEYLGSFFKEYRKPIVTVGLIFGSIVSVKLTLALLSAINEVPLLEPTFELIGLAYSAWFAYRYVFKASNREELTEEFNKIKSQVLGSRQ